MNLDLARILNDAGIEDVESAEKYLIEQLKLLQKNGKLKLGEDCNLSGISLELRVQQLFADSGFSIHPGRNRKEDFVVEAPCDSQLEDRIVIEVKSSSSPNPKIDDLRQLDDWVFDLSGEEEARKHGLGGGLDVWAMAHHGMFTSKKRHPTPHKGLMVFNGSIGTPFHERKSAILHPNHIEFAEKRNFCVISIADLPSVLSLGPEQAWQVFHETVGEYRAI